MTGNMEIFLVGGAVRDRLLGRPVKDRDWVVVGASPAALIARGFKPVGADFPVFLHPDSGEEYALARTERKSGHGYSGFTFHASPEVTLEQDLARRDLTINAMAEDAQGRMHDPYGGQRDLEARLLRHVSPAFVEDPLRVLRVARFAARYAPLGFRVADETLALMRQIVECGEIDHLVPERVWQETRRALAEPRPSAFLRTLRDSGALARLFPELDRLYGVPQRAEFHPEVDTGVHMEMVLDMAARIAPGDDLVGWLCWVHDLGKGVTAPELLPRHIGHEEAGVPLVRAMAARLKVPRDYERLGVHLCRHHLSLHQALQLRPSTLVDLFAELDLFRQPERLAPLLLACEADKRGRLGLSESDYPQAAFLREAFAAASSVQARDLDLTGLQGPQIAERLRQERIARVRARTETLKASVDAPNANC